MVEVGLRRDNDTGQKASRGTLIIGMDRGDKTSRYCVLNGEGEVVREAVWRRPAAGRKSVRESLEVHLVKRIEDGHHSCWTTLSSKLAMPNGLCRPSAFGM